MFCITVINLKGQRAWVGEEQFAASKVKANIFGKLITALDSVGQ